MPLLSFDAETGLTAPETAEIREAVANDWRNAFNTGDGSPELDTEAATPAGQLIDAHTAYIAQANAELLYLASQFNPRTAEGVWQDALGAIYFLTRKIAEPTRVTCQVTGIAGTVIPAGSLVEDEDGVRYECVRDTSIGSGDTTDVAFQCVTVGPTACGQHSIAKIVTVIPGWDTVDNATAGVMGRDVESRADFERRRFSAVAANSHGSVHSLKGALVQLDGVVDCEVLENCKDESDVLWGVIVPAHSVAVCIYGGEDDDIAETIYMKKSAGCGTAGSTTVTYTDPNSKAIYPFKILRPQATDVYLKVTIVDDGSLSASAIDDIRTAIVNDFHGASKVSGNTSVTMASTLFATRFAVAVISEAKITNLVSIEIALGQPSGYGLSITINGNVEPVIEPENIDVVITDGDA